MLNPFSFVGRVSRGQYLTWGASLMALKYAVEAAMYYVASKQVLTPFGFVNPLIKDRTSAISNNYVVMVLLIVWALPFLWIGIAMSIRRAVDAGISPLHAFFFFFPYVNLAFMLVMATLTSKSTGPTPRETESVNALRATVLSVSITSGATLLLVVLNVYVLKGYGTALFFGVPIVMGLLSGYLFNYKAERSLTSTLFVGVLTGLVSFGSIFLFAMEGAICIFMAAIPTFVMILPSAVVGRVLAVNQRSLAPIAVLALALPLVAWTETNNRLPLREVMSAVEIDAPPEVVFENVVRFPELPASDSMWFRAGVAHPLRARIEGSGVGAIRYCEFTTGPFVEPITAWEAPRRLAFDVTSQPPAMNELTPYGHINAPHLDGYLNSRRGEFRLTRLPGNRTRLEGSTWYELDVHPNWYWAMWSDAFIHKIHLEVLNHIRTISERAS